ncbi:hypothetical protein VTL71DRAFT_15822 [Oculimacula yallundae]|uniref:Uncharacterized protein n=1 Tax=Oculimacula yallundae TaxID=86028 RepID=A0ABR4CET9_9HELO
MSLSNDPQQCLVPLKVGFLCLGRSYLLPAKGHHWLGNLVGPRSKIVRAAQQLFEHSPAAQAIFSERFSLTVSHTFYQNESANNQSNRAPQQSNHFAANLQVPGAENRTAVTLHSLQLSSCSDNMLCTEFGASEFKNVYMKAISSGDERPVGSAAGRPGVTLGAPSKGKKSTVLKKATVEAPATPASAQKANKAGKGMILQHANAGQQVKDATPSKQEKLHRSPGPGAVRPDLQTRTKFSNPFTRRCEETVITRIVKSTEAFVVVLLEVEKGCFVLP